MRALLLLLHAAVTTQKTAVDAVVSISWRLNVNGANMASLLFDATEFESFWCPTSQVNRNCVQIPVYSSDLRINVFVRIWNCLSTSFEKLSEPLESLEWYAYGSD